jgi:outer membrane immunogenic protein
MRTGTDIQGSGQRGSNTSNDPFSSPFCITANGAGCLAFTPLAGTGVTSHDARIDWFGTVRGRLGTLITDQVLVYAPGGLAYGQIKVSGNSALNGAIATGSGFPFAPTFTQFSEGPTHLAVRASELVAFQGEVSRRGPALMRGRE